MLSKLSIVFLGLTFRQELAKDRNNIYTVICSLSKWQIFMNLSAYEIFLTTKYKE